MSKKNMWKHLLKKGE